MPTHSTPAPSAHVSEDRFTQARLHRLPVAAIAMQACCSNDSDEKIENAATAFEEAVLASLDAGDDLLDAHVLELVWVAGAALSNSGTQQRNRPNLQPVMRRLWASIRSRLDNLVNYQERRLPETRATLSPEEIEDWSEFLAYWGAILHKLGWAEQERDEGGAAWMRIEEEGPTTPERQSASPDPDRTPSQAGSVIAEKLSASVQASNAGSRASSKRACSEEEATRSTDEVPSQASEIEPPAAKKCKPSQPRTPCVTYPKGPNDTVYTKNNRCARCKEMWAIECICRPGEKRCIRCARARLNCEFDPTFMSIADPSFPIDVDMTPPGPTPPPSRLSESSKSPGLTMRQLTATNSHLYPEWLRTLDVLTDEERARLQYLHERALETEERIDRARAQLKDEHWVHEGLFIESECIWSDVMNRELGEDNQREEKEDVDGEYKGEGKGKERMK